MNRKPAWWILPTIAFLIIFSLGWAVEKAHADERFKPHSDHCVDRTEYRPIQLNPAITRTQLERAWGMTAADRINQTDDTSNIGTYNAYLYPACGYTFDQVQISVMTERMGRPAADPSRKPGDRVVISIVWWVLPDGYVCGESCEHD